MSGKKGKSTQEQPDAMAFYHGDGFVPAWNLATTYAGDRGRVATLPDIWDIRVASVEKAMELDPNFIRIPPELPEWESYWTTSSAEYGGLSKAGYPILIVSHGVGPMVGLDDIMKAYSHQYKDKNSDIRGGLIDRKTFLKLESGQYGDVEIVDLTEYIRKIKARGGYPFISDLSREEAAEDLVLRARLGSRWEACLRAQTRVMLATKRHYEKEEMRYLLVRGISEPRPRNIFSVDDNMNFGYPQRLQKVTDNGMAMAHLLSMGCLQALSYAGPDADLTGIVTEIGLHSWYDGTRFCGIRAEGVPKGIHPGFSDLQSKMRKYWADIAVPQSAEDAERRKNGFFRLTDDLRFTRYSADRKVLQSHEPEFHVRSATEVGHQTCEGEPRVFRTPIEGYHGIVRVNPTDVRKLAPREANAFVLGEAHIIWEDGNPTAHEMPVMFYIADVDTSRVIPKESMLLKDFDTALDLALRD